MKKSVFLTVISGLLNMYVAVAQNPITTLQHNGTTTLFYGQSSLVNALNNSVNGDTL